MIKEEVCTYLCSGVPEPYATYIKDRNQAVTAEIASILGIAKTRVLLEGNERKREEAYFVPSKPLKVDQASKLGIREKGDLFGAVVRDMSHGNKSVLHVTIPNSNLAGQAYSSDFAFRIRDAVLPGYTTFSFDEALQAYKILFSEFGSVRVKDPSESDASGQYVFMTEEDLAIFLRQYGTEKLGTEGLIVEANLCETRTLSVGQIFLGADYYSYVGSQNSVTHEGRSKYGGTKLKMVRGLLTDLAKTEVDSNVTKAISQAERVLNAFSIYEPILSRANFDVVQGFDGEGRFLSGITDQSFRLGGASPAEVLAIKELNAKASNKFVVSSVNLEYSPKQKIFLNNPNLRITAKIED